MLWVKRRSSRPDTSSPSSQQQKHQLTPSIIAVASPSSASRRASISTSTSTSSNSPRLPLAPLDPQTSASTALVTAGIDHHHHMAPTSSTSYTSTHPDSPNHAAFAKIISRKIRATNNDEEPQSMKKQPSPTQPNYAQGRPSLAPRHPGSPGVDPATPTFSYSPTSRRPSLPSLPIRGSYLPPPQSIPAHFSPSTPSPQNHAYPRGADLYVYDELATFQFGAPSSSSPSRSRPSRDDDQDMYDADDPVSPLTAADVTPRPSVVGYNSYHGTVFGQSSQAPVQPSSLYPVSSHPSQPSGHLPLPPGSSPGFHRPRSTSASVRDSDTASHHTFGESGSGSGFNSSSASISSSMSVSNSRTDSRTSAHTTDDDGGTEELFAVGRRPEASLDVEFSSEDEFEYDYDEDYEIEISSARNEDVVGPGDESRLDDFYAFNGGSMIGGGFGLGSGSLIGERRGSLPMAIPGSAGSSGNEGFYGRNREGSAATLRRPSRSLEDELRNFGAGARAGDPGADASGVASGSGIGASGAVPYSDPLRRGDWKILESKRERDKVPQRADPSGTSAMEGFDDEWGAMRTGITLGPSAVAAFVRPPLPPSSSARRPSGVSLAGGGEGRKPSWMSGMWGIGGRRQSEATVNGGFDDTFTRHVGKFDGEYGLRRGDWSFKREKADLPGGGVASSAASVVGTSVSHARGGGGLAILSSRGSMTSERASVTGDKDKEREREREREKKAKVVPKGMAVGTQEIWRNQFVGRFKVDRRAPKPPDPAKPPQQRLNLLHFQDPFSLSNNSRAGPPVTVHKHSKAIAFSISRRHARPRPRLPPPRDGGAGGGPGGYPKGKPLPRDGGNTGQPPSASRSSMIMLAPRRVQEQFTSTTTTRKLDTHGLLEDKRDGEMSFGVGSGGSGMSGRDRSAGRREREKKEKEKRRKMEEEALKAKMKGKKEKERKKDSKGESSSTSTSMTSSAGSVSSAGPSRDPYYVPAPPASAPSLHTYPPKPTDEARRSPPSFGGTRPPDSIPQQSSSPSLGSAYPARDPAFLDRSPIPPTTRTATRNHTRRDPLDFDDPDDDAPPSRTPHSETYATIDAARIENMRLLAHNRPESDQPQSRIRRLLGFPSSRSNSHAPGPMSASLDGSFRAPWVIMAPRAKQEEQERVVANLNESFVDVGLLPSRPSHRQKTANMRRQRQANHGTASGSGSGSGSGGASGVNIFEQVPQDSLYMLLPLWPGETDPASERLFPMLPKKPKIPMEDRQYLLVYYVPDEVKRSEQDSGKGRQDADHAVKKKSRSPTSSSDSNARRADDRSILLSAFHVSARLVGYNDLRGCGVRVPEEGLSVTGPMADALSTMPSPSIREENQPDFLIGVCQSREAGMEFIQEGLVKMGLCIDKPAPERTPGAPGQEEEDEPSVMLSPIGRAVVEMAWVGCMALTSFGPTA